MARQHNTETVNWDGLLYIARDHLSFEMTTFPNHCNVSQWASMPVVL